MNMVNRTISKKPSGDNRHLPGLGFEQTVCKIQQMMDENSTVTHNERLVDRVGNKRQYDVLIRGKFGGLPVMGVIECKDHSRKQGPSAIEAFAKKTENLGANLRLMVSRMGFTKPALRLAKHENIGCLSLLPNDSKQVGFNIGNMYYGIIQQWTNVRLTIHFVSNPSPVASFDANTVKANGKSVINWFIKNLLTVYGKETKEGKHCFALMLDGPHDIEVSGNIFPVLGFTCTATRINQKKRKWVHYSGDAIIDWHKNTITIPPNGTIVGSAVETDLCAWESYEGEIPETDISAAQLPTVIMHNTQKWDELKDNDLADLASYNLNHTRLE